MIVYVIGNDQPQYGPVFCLARDFVGPFLLRPGLRSAKRVSGPAFVLALFAFGQFFVRRIFVSTRVFVRLQVLFGRVFVPVCFCFVFCR